MCSACYGLGSRKSLGCSNKALSFDPDSIRDMKLKVYLLHHAQCLSVAKAAFAGHHYSGFVQVCYDGEDNLAGSYSCLSFDRGTSKS